MELDWELPAMLISISPGPAPQGTAPGFPGSVPAARLLQLGEGGGKRLERNDAPWVTQFAEGLPILSRIGADIEHQINAVELQQAAQPGVRMPRRGEPHEIPA